jgi:hypothetical protein
MHFTKTRVALLACALWLGVAGLGRSQPVDEEPAATSQALPAADATPLPVEEGQPARDQGGLGHLFSVGFQASVGDEPGVGGRVVLTPDKHTGFELLGTFDYYFPDEYSDSWYAEDYSYLETGLTMAYKFRDREDSFRPYLGWGLVVARSSHTARFPDGSIPDQVSSSTELKWGSSVGALFGRGRTKLFIESRLTLQADRSLVLSAGVRFGGRPAPKYRHVAQPRPGVPGEAGVRSEEDIRSRACPARNVGFSVKADKSRHPTPAPAPGQALVYVLRPARIGFAIQTRLAVDGEWVGANRGRQYFYLNLDPGVHYFCSRSENVSVLAMRLEAGRTYFLEQKIKAGLLKARNKLVLLSEAEGRDQLAECHLSISVQKD